MSSTNGTLTINCDAIVNLNSSGGVVKRPIPCFRMYSNVSVSIPSTTTTNITMTTVDTDYTTADLPTGFTYSNGRFTNSTSEALVIHVAYSITYTNTTASTRISWIQVGNLSGRHGQVGTAGSNLEPTVSGSGIFKIASGQWFAVQVFQNTGVAVNAVATGYNSPYISITVL